MALLTGKVAWVTGAGSGIGEAAAIALAREGATVVLTGRRKEPLEGEAATDQEGGRQGRGAAGDLISADVGDRALLGHRQEIRPLDILVNNAGPNIPARNWASSTPAGADHGARRQSVERLLLLSRCCP